jgi:curved DNA-binding protein CbpA
LLRLDIRVMAAPDRTHYEVLGISRDADAAAVRAAWKLHVQVWHPDRFTGDMREEAERQAMRINEAYTCLRDGSRRAAYDCRLAADDAASRPEPPTQRRSATKVRPAAPRPASTPVGAPMAQPVPLTLGEQVASMGSEALDVVRRHPKVFITAAAVWLLVFGGSIAMHVLSTPALPTGPATATAASVQVAGPSSDDLEQLAEEARLDSAKSDAAMAAQLRKDEAAQRAAEIAAARQDALLARRAAAAAAKLPRAVAGAPTTGRHIVRVMPTSVR